LLLLPARPLARALLQEWKAAMNGLAPSTVNVKLSTVRRLNGEARRNGLIGAEDAANLSELADLEISDLQEREGGWVIADLCGKCNRIRTVAVPLWSSTRSMVG
jgi:hypothetical protein